MSFAVDLWDGLNAIKVQYTSTFNKMSNLCNILLYYSNCQKTYSKNLESLYKDNKDSIKEDYLLDKSILELINNFKLESEYHREHYKYIKKKVVVSIKEIIEKGKASFNNIFNEGIQIQENFNKTKNNLINKQKIYNNSLKDFYSFITNFNENEINYILENEKISNDSLSPNTDNEINRIIAKSQTEIKIDNIICIDNKINKQQMAKKEKLIDKISENKNEYITVINESNEYLKVYRNSFENVLQSLEEKYKLLIETIHSSLISTMDQRILLINKLQLLYSNFLEQNIKKIQIKDEITEFIIRNVTKEFPINKFEFISCKYENKISNLDINKYIDKIVNEESMYPGNRRGKSRKKTEIRNFRRRSIKKKNTGHKTENAVKHLENNAIFTDIKKYKIKSNILLIDDFVEELITSRGDEEKINIDNVYYHDSSSKMMDVSYIKSLIDKKNNECIVYIENLMKSINNKRAKGNYVINKKSYDAFIDIFKFLLDNYPTSDFILKNIIILSQTLYTYENDKNDESNSIYEKKVFLQNGLKNNPVFNKEETWHRVINFTLSTNVVSKDISQPIDKNEIYNK